MENSFITNKQIAQIRWKINPATRPLSYFIDKSQNSVDNAFLCYWMFLCASDLHELSDGLIKHIFLSGMV